MASPSPASPQQPAARHNPHRPAGTRHAGPRPIRLRQCAACAACIALQSAGQGSSSPQLQQLQAASCPRQSRVLRELHRYWLPSLPCRTQFWCRTLWRRRPCQGHPATSPQGVRAAVGPPGPVSAGHSDRYEGGRTRLAKDPGRGGHEVGQSEQGSNSGPAARKPRLTQVPGTGSICPTTPAAHIGQPPCSSVPFPVGAEAAPSAADGVRAHASQEHGSPHQPDSSRPSLRLTGAAQLPRGAKLGRGLPLRRDSLHSHSSLRTIHSRLPPALLPPMPPLSPPH